MPIPLLVYIAAAVIAVAVSVIFMPKPKVKKPDATTDLENPVAEAGKPVPVVFGTYRVQGLNILWYGDKKARTFMITPGEGGKKGK